MSKLYVQNLGLIVTERCNLKCKNCLCGGSFCRDMSDDVIATTLSQVDFIGNLCLCGREITLAILTVEGILTYIVDNMVALGTFSTIINGTIYSEEPLRLLDYINGYIPSKKGYKNVMFGISKDVFHDDEVLRLGMGEQFIDNLQKYVKSPYFYSWREIDKKLYREGSAVFLDESLIVPLRPYPIVYSYLRKKDVLKVGTLVCVNTDGVVTECDASIENQKLLYNCGSVMNENLADICTRIGTMVHPLLWDGKTAKILCKQWTYEK